MLGQWFDYSEQELDLFFLDEKLGYIRFKHEEDQCFWKFITKLKSEINIERPQKLFKNVEKVFKWLDNTFLRINTEIDFEYEVLATDFEKAVYKELQNVKIGEIITYKSLAEKINCNSARAIGNCMNKNPLPIIIPCHRVIGSNGHLVGFRGGLDYKRKLLSLEKK